MKGRLILLNLLILMFLLRLMDFSIEVIRLSPSRLNHLLGDADIEYKRRLHPPMVDARFTTTSEYLSRCDGLDSSTFRLVTDRDGLIQDPSCRGSLVKRVDVLFVGGSTAECLYVDDSLRFPYLVGERLRRFHGLERVTLNGGYSGNHTYHSIANLVYTFLKLKPRVVVLMHNINDLALLSKTGSYHVAPPSRALTVDTRMDGRLETLFGFARYLYPNLTRSVSRVLRKIRSGTTAPDEFEGLRGGVEVPEGRILEEFERALSTFHGICHSNGIELVLMTQFNRMDSLNLPYLRRIGASNGLSDLPRWIPVYTRMNQAIRDYSAREGLLCIDLDRLIPHDRRYIYDPVHLNNAGSRLAAEVISRELAGRLSFASDGVPQRRKEEAPDGTGSLQQK